MNAVPCIKWLRQGVAKRHPDKVKLDPEELKRLIKSHGDDLEALALSDGSGDEEDSMEEKPSTSGATKRKKVSSSQEEDEEDSDNEEEGGNSSDEDVAKKYGLDNYDEEDDDIAEDINGMGLNNVAQFLSNEEDPYLENDQDSDAEELEILPDDNLVAVAKVHGDYNTLEVHVYEGGKSNMYCHHDLLLPTFPLAIEWLDFDPSAPDTGNYLAMSSMEPNIDVWDLDVIDALEPAFVLAGASRKKGKKKKKSAVTGHTDAVLSLSWNKNQRQVLASGSADFTVGLWDLSQGKMVTTVQHQEKVQSVEWHPVEPQSLLTGSFDKEVKVFDCRSPQDSFKKWSVSGEVEDTKWNKHDPYYFLVGTDDGNVAYFDVRNSEPVTVWKAHEAATTAVAIDEKIPGCLVTVSSDKSLKVWDMREPDPTLVSEKHLGMGQLYSTDMCPDSPLLIAVGGEREHRVIDLKKNQAVTKCWGLTFEEGIEETAGETLNEGFSDEEDIAEEMKKEAASVEISEKKKKKKKPKKKKKQNAENDQQEQ